MMYFLSVVLIGTVYPIFLEVIADEKISVGPPFYTKLLIPFLIESGVDGLLVESNDVIPMVSKIKMLLDDHSLVQNLTINARKKASSMDWNSIKNEWIKILT